MTRLEIGLRNLILNKKKFFWVLNISGWLIFCILWAIPFINKAHSLWYYTTIILSDFFVCTVSSIILRFLYIEMRQYKLNYLIIILIIIISLLFVSFIQVILDGIVGIIIRGKSFAYFNTLKGQELVKRMMQTMVLLQLWSALYFLINIIYKLNNEMLNKEKALQLAISFKMEVLKNQIDPHFIFNSLNSISSLIPDNSKKALKMIEELSDFLRFTLLHKNHKRILLKEELNFIKHYIYIQVIRFEERLECKYDIDSNSLNKEIIPVILYPIVENAIKHGMNTSTMPLKIEIRVKLHSNFIEINVRNSGTWEENKIPGNGSTHTGLINISERLKCEYGDEASLQILKESNFVEVRLTIPIE